MTNLVLLDGNAIIHRAYHALPPLTDRQGRLVNAVYGFCTMLLKVIADLEPTHLAVAFDTVQPTFRHAAYVGYQAHRPRLESDLSEQFGITQELIGAIGIPVYFLAGYEADDVIGTIATRVVQEKLVDEVIIVTGDRDLLQLVNMNVKVYIPIKGLSEARLFDLSEVEKYLGVRPDQVVDYKALIGDASDNYPGVPGIGPKTAVALLKQFGTFENIFKAVEDKKLDGFSSAVIDKLAHGYDSGVLSKQLATIEKDVPITFDFEASKLPTLKDNPKAIEVLGELGFKSLVARLQTKNSEQKKSDNQMNLI